MTLQNESTSEVQWLALEEVCGKTRPDPQHAAQYADVCFACFDPLPMLELNQSKVLVCCYSWLQFTELPICILNFRRQDVLHIKN